MLQIQQHLSPLPHHAYFSGFAEGNLSDLASEIARRRNETPKRAQEERVNESAAKSERRNPATMADGDFNVVPGLTRDLWRPHDDLF